MLSISILEYWFLVLAEILLFGKDKNIKVCKETQNKANSIAHGYLKEEKRGINQSGVQSGRSGGHGTPFKRIGSRMIEEANSITDEELKKAYKIIGKRFIVKGKSINHR